MNYEFYQLENGIRIAHHRSNRHVAHCGVTIGAGSRDEGVTEQGLAHFIEHVIFKGTQKRKVYHIMSRLDSVGGELNAFTTKEETCIYASFVNKYYSRSLELMADILMNSTFPAKELEKEKDIIIDEINSYKDSPHEQIYDDFEELIFDGHSIGRNILGNKKNIKKFSKQHIEQFIHTNYHPENIVISSVGNISMKRLVQYIEKYFSNIPFLKGKNRREKFVSYQPKTKKINKKTYQTHCVIGNITCDYNDPGRIPMALMNNLLGGPGLNSRLNLSIREKHGLAYNIDSIYQAYSDIGLFNIYVGINNGSLDKTLHYIFQELNILRNNSLGTLQLAAAKKQLIGQLALAYDSNMSIMLMMGKSLLLSDTILSISDITERIDKVTSSELLELANIVFDPDKLSMIAYISK